MSKSLIYQAEDVKINLEKSDPTKLGLKALGFTATGGWSSPALIPYRYPMPPTDGIQDFGFVAQPPDGVATQVLTPIEAATEILNPPAWLRGVRVHAVTNAREALIGHRSILELVQPDSATADALKTVGLKISVATYRVYSWWIIIEGQTFYPQQFKPDGSMFHLELPAYPVEGALDVILQANGSDNGVDIGRAAARIAANGVVLSPELQLRTIKNHGIDRKSYNV